MKAISVRTVNPFEGIEPNPRTPEEIQEQREHEERLTWTGSRFDESMSPKDIAAAIRRDIAAVVKSGELLDAGYRVTMRSHIHEGAEFTIAIHCRWMDESDPREFLVNLANAYNWQKATGEAMQSDGCKSVNLFSVDIRFRN